MLSKKIHIEQIERFHSKMESITEEIEKNKNDESKKDLVYNLCLQYFKMSELWNKIDEFIELTVKHEIDFLQDN